MLKKKTAAVLAMAALCVQPVFAQDINVFVNDNLVSFSNQKPVIVDGRTLIPLRGVFEKLFFTVEWDANTKTAILSSDLCYISIQANSPTFSVNKLTKELDVPAQIINGSMMIPLRAVSECTGIKVEWDAVTKSANINTGHTVSEVLDNFAYVSEYLQNYNKAVEPLSNVLTSFQLAITSGDTGQMKTGFSSLKTTSANVRATLNELDPPVICGKIHVLSTEMLDLIDEFSTFTLQLLENPESITPDDLAKIKEYTTKAKEIKSEIETEKNRLQNYVNFQ